MNDKPGQRVLVVDDRRDIFEFCERFLGEGRSFLHAPNGRDALALLAAGGITAVLLDRDFSQADRAGLVGPPDDVRNEGLHILAAIRRREASLPVLMVTGLRDSATAEQAARLQADFLAWEDVVADPALLAARLDLAVLRAGGERDEVVARFAAQGAIAASPRMKDVLARLAPALGDSVPVLLLGPTGSGKDWLARALHALGPNPKGPFIEVNAATLDASQANNELFGHVKGSYTDAREDWKGLLASADGGTFFLNEVGDLPPDTQARLLSVLEGGQVRQIGTARLLPARFRLVCATSRDLVALVASGRFREDLWHRIAGHVVCLPPLALRVEDIEPLACAFLAATPAVAAGRVRGFAREALEYLRRQPWPGNVRGLQRVVEVAAAAAVHTVSVADLRAALAHVDTLEIARTAPSPCAGTDAAGSPAMAMARAEDLVFCGRRLRDVQRAYFFHVLRRTGGNLAAAARLAGVAKSTMYEWRLRHAQDNDGDDDGDGDVDKDNGEQDDGSRDEDQDDDGAPRPAPIR